MGQRKTKTERSAERLAQWALQAETVGAIEAENGAQGGERAERQVNGDPTLHVTTNTRFETATLLDGTILAGEIYIRELEIPGTDAHTGTFFLVDRSHGTVVPLSQVAKLVRR